ncbi:MAG: hypothetical protein U0797_12995 [Gemmataceae bacterium]
MALKKVKVTAALVLAAGMVAFGGGLLGRGGAAEDSPRPKEAANPAPAPVAKPAPDRSKVEISSDGKRAEVRAILGGKQLVASADKVNFDSGRNLLVLEGSVRLRLQGSQGSKPQLLEADKIIIRSEGDDFSIQGQGMYTIQGSGVKLTVPQLGPKPVPLDFGFPVVRDEAQLFNFYLGLFR